MNPVEYKNAGPFVLLQVCLRNCLLYETSVWSYLIIIIIIIIIIINVIMIVFFFFFFFFIFCDKDLLRVNFLCQSYCDKETLFV